MKHVPLLLICGAFLTGIVVEHYAPIPPALLVAACVALPIIAAALVRVKSRNAGLAVVYLLVVTAGAATHCYHYRFVPADHVVHLLGDDRKMLKLEGTIRSDPVFKRSPVPLLKRELAVRPDESFSTSCEVELSAVHLESGETLPVSGLIILKVYEKMTKLRYGDRLTFIAYVQVPNTPTNPGAFDYREFLRRRGILTAATVPEPSAILDRTPGGGWWSMRMIFGLRRAAADVIKRHLPPDRAALAVAILLGDRSGLSGSTRDAFQRSGTMHLLAVSGLHVGMVATGLWLLLRIIKDAAPRCRACRRGRRVVLRGVDGYASAGGSGGGFVHGDLVGCDDRPA